MISNHLKRFFAVVFCLSFSLSFFFISSLRAEEKTPEIVIMATSDIHNYVRSYDYYRDREISEYGLSKAATLIKKIRKEYPDAILVDNGDTIQGNPMADLAYKSYFSKKLKGPISIITAMNQLKYDVMEVGNHDFNYGINYLEKVIKDAKFPIICSNMFSVGKKGEADKSKPFLTEYKIIKRKIKGQPVAIGFIGIAPPGIEKWDMRHIKGKYVVTDALQATKEVLERVKKEGAEIVVALVHGGIEVEASYKDRTDNPGYYIAKLDGVDAVVTGHAHAEFPSKDFFGQGKENKENKDIDIKQGTIFGKPVVMPRYWGSHLGVIKLKLKRAGDSWKALSGSGEILAVKDSYEDKEVMKVAQKEHTATLRYIRTPLASLLNPVNSFFSRVTDTAVVQIINDAQTEFVKERLKDTEYKDLPVLSAAASFRSGFGGREDYTNIKQGKISFKHVSDIYMYPNTISAVKVNGAAIKDWLEQSAKNYATFDPRIDEEVNILNPQFKPYNFDVIDGITYEIDISKPVGERIQDIKWQGKPLEMSMEFVVATNNYRASGGGSFPHLDGSNIIFDDLIENRDIVLEYLRMKKVVEAKPDNNWKLALIPDLKAKLYFESSIDGEAFKNTPLITPDTSGKDLRDGYLRKYFISLGK